MRINSVPMILVGATPVSVVLGAAAAVAYAVPALAAHRVGLLSARRLLLAAWALHGLQLGWLIAGEPARFGFAQTLSITVWLVLTIYLVETRLYPRMPIRWALAGFGSLAIILAFIYPGAHLPDTTSPLLALHWALGLTAYGLLAVAVAHGWLMRRAEQAMRGTGADDASGIPLLKLERLMFRFVGAGFVLLTLTLVVGTFFGEQLYGPVDLGWHWDHKHVFTVLSWIVFAALLVGHWRFGWRGRRAVRMLNTGAVLLLLGYVGSRFVMEVLLGRTG